MPNSWAPRQERPQIGLKQALNEQDFSKLTVKKAKAHSSVAAIDIALRTVNNPVFTQLCSQEHPGMRAERKREAFYILCPASSLMDVPGYVNPDKLMNVPMGFVCR